MRRLLQTGIVAVVGVFLAGTSSAEVTACDLVKKSDVELITGLAVGEPEAQELSVCAGLCESFHGWSCVYVAHERGRAESVEILMYLPPFEPGNWIAVTREISSWGNHVPAVDVQVLGSPALWDFDAQRSILHVFNDPRMHIVVIQTEADENAVAFKKATALAALIDQRTD